MPYSLDIYHNEREPAYKTILFKTDDYASAMQNSHRRWADARHKHLTDPGDFWTLSDPNGIIYHSVLGRIRETD